MSDQGATQEGVLKPEDPRAAIIDAIVAKQQEELEPVGEEVEYEEKAPQEEPKEEEKEEAPSEEVEAKSEAPQETQPTEQMVRVKVDGQEEEVPLSRVLAQYQKNSAADRRLEEASKAIAEAKALKAEIAALKQPKEEPKKRPTLPADLADAFRATVKAQLEVTDPEEYALLEEQKGMIQREAWKREQQEEVAKWQDQQRAIEQRQAQERFLASVSEKHSDASRYIKVDLEAGRVDFDEGFTSWLDTQPPWMKHALLAPDPSGPIYVLDQFKATLQPNLSEKLEAKRRMDNPPTANKKSEKPRDDGDDDESPQSYVRKLNEMRSPTKFRKAI